MSARMWLLYVFAALLWHGTGRRTCRPRHITAIPFSQGPDILLFHSPDPDSNERSPASASAPSLSSSSSSFTASHRTAAQHLATAYTMGANQLTALEEHIASASVALPARQQDLCQEEAVPEWEAPPPFAISSKISTASDGQALLGETGVRYLNVGAGNLEACLFTAYWSGAGSDRWLHVGLPDEAQAFDSQSAFGQPYGEIRVHSGLHDVVATIDEAPPSREGLPLERYTLFTLRHNASSAYPFPDQSFRHIFSEHFIEHVGPGEATAALRELWRLLEPGGTIRLSTPDLAIYARGYVEGREGRDDQAGANLDRQAAPGSSSGSSGSNTFFRDWGKIVFGGARTDDDTVPAPPASKAELFNNIMRNYGHQFIHDFESLRRLAIRAGIPAAAFQRDSFRGGPQQQGRHVHGQAQGEEGEAGDRDDGDDHASAATARFGPLPPELRVDQEWRRPETMYIRIAKAKQ